MHAEAADKNNALAEGQCLQQMGQICFNQGHYAQALDFYLHADKLFDAVGNKSYLAANMNDMGVLCYYNKQLDKSRSLYNKALTIYKQDGNIKGQAEVLGNVGHLYEKHKQYDSAFFYQRLALAQYSKINDRAGEAKIYENLGSIHEDLARYDSARYYFNQSLQLYKLSGNTTASIEVINNIGDIYRKTGHYKESIAHSKNAYNMALQADNTYQLASSCRDLGKAYQLLHQLDSAYQYLELSRKYSLDVYSKDGVSQTAFLQVLYDMNKKSDEIAHLNSIRKTNRIIGVAIGTVIILLVVLGVVIFSRQRLKIQDQKILAAQRDARVKAEHDLMQLELQNKQLQEVGLKQQLELKSKELSNHTLNLIKNNQLLEDMRNTLQEMVKDDKRDQKRQMQQLIQQINQSFNHEQHWKEFTTAFAQVHQSFFDNLKTYSSDLTSADVRLVTLMKINLDSKDIATLLGISMDSLRVARHRLRRKLNIDQGDNLSAFIQAL
uniref:tetratricopeptide repeat protein n=1 Tax=Mucilaginibacter sp. Bleaf8 TaxID=2834430 RepID=UPI0020BFA54F|nr:tetratricopeptide repeat protein [Mucilaginibacter sp. Bleaf8]